MRIRFIYRHTTAVFLIILLTTAVLPLRAAPAGQTAVTQADYWQHIRELQQLVSELEGQPEAEQQTQLSAAADELAQITAVTLDNGQTIPIDHGFLLKELQAIPPDLSRLSGLLDTLVAADGSWPDAQFDASAAIPLAEILARDEFQYQPDEPNALEQWLLDLQQKFLEWVAEVAPEANWQIGDFIGNVLAVLASLALVAILFIALRDMITDFTADAEFATEGDAAEVPLTAETALARAQTLSESGDNRTAVRYLYLSSLLQMEERGLLRYDRSRTNQEYLRLVQSQPELAETLTDVVTVFDRVWYGYQPIDEETFVHYHNRVVALKRIRNKES